MAKDITNEQLFEFMTKMYGEMQEGFKEVKHDIVGLEDKMDTNHKVLHDGYKLTYEKLTTLEDKVDKLDKLELNIMKG